METFQKHCSKRAQGAGVNCK